MTTRTPEQTSGEAHPPNARRMYLGGLRTSLKGDPRLSVKMVDDRGLVYLEVTEPTRDNTVEVGADFIDGQWMFIRREDGFRMGHAMDCFGATRIIQIVLGLG